MPPVQARPGPFHLRNFGGRDLALAVIAPAEHQDRDCGGEETEDRHPPDVPDQRKAGDHRKESDDETGRAVARHVDGFIGLFDRAHSPLLHLPEGIDRLDAGQHGEIVGRGRRRGRPLQGPAVPRVAGQVAAALARADADVELCDLAENADEDDDRPGLRDQQQRLPARVGDVLEAPGHAHQAQGVERHEGEIEADEPAPEAGLAEPLVEGEAERLREPVIVAREHPEHDAADDDVVEMGDQEGAVVQHEIDRRDRQENAGQAADDERDHEADRNSIGVLNTIRPRNMVNSQLKTLTPVGTAMIVDMMPKKALTSAPAPIVKK